MEGFLDGAVVFVAHVAGVEDEPEEDNNHGDEHKARGRAPWHLGQKACFDVTNECVGGERSETRRNSSGKRIRKVGRKSLHFPRS